MTWMLVVSNVLLWVLVIILACLVLLLYRQFGLIYIGSRERIEQTGLALGKRPREGLPLVVEGSRIGWSWRVSSPLRGTVAVMATPECNICADLIPRLDELTGQWGDFRFVVVDRATNSGPRDLPSPRAWLYGLDVEGEVHAALDVEATPYAFVLDDSGRIMAKGIVNYIHSIEALIERGLRPEGADALRTSSPAHPAPGV